MYRKLEGTRANGPRILAPVEGWWSVSQCSVDNSVMVDCVTV